MTTFAQPDTEHDARTRAAWRAYRDELRELGGAAYAAAEATAWEQLQATLREIERRRDELTALGRR